MKFFKILLPGFHSKLQLPSAFCKTAAAEYSPQAKAVVTTHLGTWKIPIANSNGKFYFQGDSSNNNWVSFTQEHELRVGDLIVFEHLGRMVFTASVYDVSACEKDFSAKLPAARRRYHGRLNEDGTASDHAPTFQKIISKSTKKVSLFLPSRFWEKNSMPRRNRVIVRMGERGKEHEVKLVSYGPVYGIRMVMTKGWPEFCISNGIQVGDGCFFQVMDINYGESNDVLIQVTRSEESDNDY